MPRGTLRKFLNQANPLLDNRVFRPSEVTDKEMKNWGWPKIPKATKWNLTLGYINATFGFLLDKEFDFPDHIMDLPDTEKVVFDERSFELLVARWNSRIVDIALEVVSKALAHVPEFPKLCVASGSSGTSNNKIGKPDWAVVPSQTPAGKQHTCLAPGDTKATRKKYDSSIPVDNKENVWALKYMAQTGHYSNMRSTRYFWCITPTEIMVCRRRTSRSRNEIIPQVATFSWIPGHRQTISVNLVLFFVVLAAGLGNGVRSTYQHMREEHKTKINKIKAAVQAL